MFAATVQATGARACLIMLQRFRVRKKRARPREQFVRRILIDVHCAMLVDLLHVREQIHILRGKMIGENAVEPALRMFLNPIHEHIEVAVT
jgi:hypothetical protein